MFEKKIAGKVSKVIKPKEQFPTGTQFVFDKDLWRVMAEIKESGADMRRIKKLHVSDSDAEELILTMASLKKDMQSEGFSFVED